MGSTVQLGLHQNPRKDSEFQKLHWWTDTYRSPIIRSSFFTSRNQHYCTYIVLNDQELLQIMFYIYFFILNAIASAISIMCPSFHFHENGILSIA